MGKKSKKKRDLDVNEKYSFILNKTKTIFFDIIEKYLPALIFSALFIAMMLQIFFRYFIRPLTWPIEFILLCYIWLVLLGSCYATRDSSHIKFTLIYEKSSNRVQLIMRLVGNLMVVISFIIALYPSYKYISFMGFKKTNVLKIPMDIAFSPFLLFLLIVIYRFSIRIIEDITILINMIVNTNFRKKINKKEKSG